MFLALFGVKSLATDDTHNCVKSLENNQHYNIILLYLMEMQIKIIFKTLQVLTFLFSNQ